MNKFIKLLFILLFSTTYLFANSNKYTPVEKTDTTSKVLVNFETGSYKDAVLKAKKKKMLLFVDAYTTWCGPCKTMDKEVFSNRKVANYFNRNFICYKMDMQGENVPIFFLSRIVAFPTFLFLDENGRIAHTVVGAYPAKEYLKLVKKGLKK